MRSRGCWVEALWKGVGCRLHSRLLEENHQKRGQCEGDQKCHMSGICGGANDR